MNHLRLMNLRFKVMPLILLSRTTKGTSRCTQIVQGINPERDGWVAYRSQYLSLRFQRFSCCHEDDRHSNHLSTKWPDDHTTRCLRGCKWVPALSIPQVEVLTPQANTDRIKQTGSNLIFGGTCRVRPTLFQINRQCLSKN